MELKNNQGILFENKKTKDSQPDYTGEVNIDGNVMRIALWKKQSAKGNTYLSVQISQEKPKEEKPQEVKQENVYNDLNDAIPF